MQNLEAFNGKHKGQPALIVSSGTSVFGLKFNHTDKFVTIAVNSGYVVPFDSHYFVSDDHDVSNWSFFSGKLARSVTTPVLYEQKFQNSGKQFGDRAVYFRHRTGYKITDVYSHSAKENYICQARTSVGSAIHIAHIMGCSPIGLLGVDCFRQNGCRYFWQLAPNKYDYPHRRDKIMPDTFRRIMNAGTSTDVDLIDILKYWKNHGLMISHKCQVYNLSQKSLVNVFPKMSYDEFVRKNA